MPGLELILSHTRGRGQGQLCGPSAPRGPLNLCLLPVAARSGLSPAPCGRCRRPPLPFGGVSPRPRQFLLHAHGSLLGCTLRRETAPTSGAPSEHGSPLSGPLTRRHEVPGPSGTLPAGGAHHGPPQTPPRQRAGCEHSSPRGLSPLRGRRPCLWPGALGLENHRFLWGSHVLVRSGVDSGGGT